MGRKALTYLALFVLLAILGYLVYQRVEDQRMAEAARQQAEMRYAEVLRDEANAKKLPQPDRGLEWLPAAYPRPPSAWRSSEKARYEAILGKGRFDVLVVPFQVQDQAFGRDIRSFMTAQLAMAIGEAGKASVADPYLVAKALGDGERRLSIPDIFRLANAVGAKRIVAGYVGHDLANVMRVTLHLYERNERELFDEYVFGPRPAKYGARAVASERLKSQDFEKIAYTGESTPVDAFQATLPAMIKFLGIDPAALASAKPQSRFEEAALPKSPLALVSETAEPARDAYFLQLMATLTPRRAERERERLLEKSLLALSRMSPESPDYRLLKARALMHMGLRPAALRVLGTPGTAEEKHLFAVLNGNLTEVRANRSAVPAGARALMALLEQTAIAAAYDVYDAKAAAADMAALKLPGEMWPYLARRALAETDWWAQYDNIALKALLDRELPVEGFTAEAMLRGAATVGDMDKLRTVADLSVLEHARKRLERSAAQACCQPLAARLTESDFLDVVESVGTDNLSRRARFFIHTQGSPASGMEFLAKIEAAYKDHPDFVLQRGYAEIALAASASGPEREGLLKAAYLDGFNVWYWEQGQTRIAAEAESYVVQRSHREDFGPHPDPYTYDYPMRTYYPYWDTDERLVRIVLDNSCFDLGPATHLVSLLGKEQNRWDQVDELLQSLEGRFNGNPERIKLTASALARKGDYKALEQQYAEGIRLQPAAEELYTELGKLLFRNGETDRAAKVFMSFPGLKDRKTKPVELSNYAYEAGSLYYWSGDFKRALPFYKVAADLETGSAASIASATRIALLNGDYATALRGSVARAQRYKSPHAYRDYLGMLHAMGFSKEAWEGFDTLIRQIDKPQVWETALVGHQMEGRSEAEIAAWAAQEPTKSAGRWPYAAMYMLRAGVTDRKPTAELPARIAALDRSGWKIGESELFFGPPPRGSYLPRKSRLLYYAEAYAAMRSGKFAEASAGLQAASTLYGVRDSEASILPLYAYVAARAGDTASLEKALEIFPPEEQGFDYQLAKGILAALAGKRDASLEHLKLALVRRPFTEYRAIFTEYQYAEVCEWLYDATRDARYRNLALDWAKKNEAVNPWFAWPYAVEARLSTDPAARGRAMAMAYYLDRKSERLGRLPKTEVQNAVKEYANRNPFRRAVDRTPKQPA
jgi:hypothetical protein